MATFLLTLLIFLVAITGLALGAIAGRAPLAGTCRSRTCDGGGVCGGCRQSTAGGREP